MVDCAYPSMRIVCTDWAPEDWEKVVNDYGLSTMMYMTGMEAGELLPPRRPAPDLDIRRVDNEELARHAAMINAHAYGMPAEMFECIANMQLWHDDSYAFVGFTGGRPVSCAAAFPVDDTVYIALVATMPDSHGNGYAEAVMRHTVVTGQREMGTMRTTLHATDMAALFIRRWVIPVARGSPSLRRLIKKDRLQGGETGRRFDTEPGEKSSDRLTLPALTECHKLPGISRVKT